MATILVVDDEMMIRNVIRKGLVRAGHTVFEAKQGNEAMKYLEEKDIDLVIIDLVMPEKGGIETLIEVYEKYRWVKKIVISGKIDTGKDSIQGLAKQFHVDAVYTKPFEIFDLLNSVNELTT